MNNKSTTRWAGVLPLWLGVLCSQAMNVSAFCPNQQLPGAVHSSLLAFAPPAHHHRIHAQKQIRGIEAVDQLPWTRRQAGSSRGGARLTMDFSIASLFSSFRKQKVKKKSNAAVLSEELFTMLSDKSIKVEDEAVMKKIEMLEAEPGVTFNAEYLYDGPWRVLWKTNTAWQRYFDPFNAVADNRAYQWYKGDGSVTNIAQALGDKLYITVDGQGKSPSTSKELPYEVNVEVSRGWLHALGRKVPLDFIKGKGTTFVVYIDPKLRVFRSDTGGVVVQTKAEEVVPV